MDEPKGALSVLPQTKGHVLLVDDDLGLLKAYARVLRESGFAVEEVSDGSMAMRALEEDDFDLVRNREAERRLHLGLQRGRARYSL